MIVESIDVSLCFKGEVLSCKHGNTACDALVQGGRIETYIDALPLKTSDLNRTDILTQLTVSVRRYFSLGTAIAFVLREFELVSCLVHILFPSY